MPQTDLCEEPFVLRNDPPPKEQGKQPVCDDNDKCRQRMLLDGLDCLPGQRDLFDEI